MPRTHTFRFVSSERTKQLIAALKAARIKHSVDQRGNIRYSADDEKRIENEFIERFRDACFPSWQLVFCAANWADRYRLYMQRHKIPFDEQLVDNEPSFLIPSHYRPHLWNLSSVEGADSRNARGSGYRRASSSLMRNRS
jgi:hypothetical protein